MSLKEDLKLDITELDRAALSQASLYYEQSLLWAEAINARDRLKERISTKKAEVDEDIRSRPRSYGWELEKNPTETWVSNQVMIHPDVQELTEQLLTAQYQVNMMAVGKEALDHRMNAIRIMTELYKGNYFSATSKSSELSAHSIERHNDEQRKAISSSPRILKRLKHE